MIIQRIVLAIVCSCLATNEVFADRNRAIVEMTCIPEQSMVRSDSGGFRETLGDALVNDLAMRPFNFNSVTGVQTLLVEDAIPIKYEAQNLGKQIRYPLFYVYGRFAPTALWLLNYPETPSGELAFTKVLGAKLVSGRCFETTN